MPEASPFPPLDIPQTDILTWLYPTEATTSHLPSTPNTASLTSPTRPTNAPIFHSASHPTRHLTSTTLLSWIRRLGLGLQRLGLQRGDVVLIFSTNHIYVPVVYLGAPGFGYVFSGVNPAYGVHETRYQIENTGAKVLLVEPALLDVALPAAEKAGLGRERIFLFDEEYCQTVQGVKDWSTMLAGEEEAREVRWKALGPEEARTTTAVLNYSSGTTGLPKGVCVSHLNIISNTEQSLYMRALRSSSPTSLIHPLIAPDEVWLGFLPLYHAFGQLWSIAAAARARVPIYYMRSFEYRTWLSHIVTHRITHIVTAPPILVMLAKRPETSDFDLGSLRHVICGGAPLSRELQNEVMERVGGAKRRVGDGGGGAGAEGDVDVEGGRLSVVQTCGATEATCSHVHVPGMMRDTSGSVGLVDPGCVIRLVDDEGREVGDDERGEIWVKGPNIVLGYWKNEEATKSSFVNDGVGGWWWKSGDVAIKRKGWFWIVDRKKELIKVKGFQVAPAELEAALLENEDVADAAVVALKLDHDERPRAYVSLKDHARGKLKEKDVVDWMAKRVAKHKHLTGGVAFVDAVPKSPSGKIQRVIMRDWAARDARAMESKGAKAKL